MKIDSKDFKTYRSTATCKALHLVSDDLPDDEVLEIGGTSGGKGDYLVQADDGSFAIVAAAEFEAAWGSPSGGKTTLEVS